MPYTYILKTAKNTDYIGSTDDLNNRLKLHQNGKVRSTKDKRPVQLISKEYYKTRSEAQKKEYKIKNWKSRKMIEKIINLGAFV